jgi:hypothetical protein
METILDVDQTTPQRTIVFIRIYCHRFITMMMVMINTIIIGKKFHARLLQIYRQKKKTLTAYDISQISFRTIPVFDC